MDKRFANSLDKLKATGYPFQVKIFKELGQGGLAGEHPDRCVSEMTEAYEASLV